MQIHSEMIQRILQKVANYQCLLEWFPHLLFQTGIFYSKKSEDPPKKLNRTGSKSPPGLGLPNLAKNDLSNVVGLFL
jgi:hypothetical protein